MAEETTNVASVVLRITDKASPAVKAFAGNVHRAFQQVTTATATVAHAMGRVVGAFRSVIGGIFGIGNSIKALVLGATIFGIVRALDRLIERGADVKRVTEGFTALTGGVHGFGAALVGATRTATKGLITDLQLMRQANQAVLLGLPVTAASFAELARGATILGRAVGRDAATALEDLTTGIGRQSRLILDNLGLLVDAEAANQKYARAHGKTADALSEVEKKMAFYDAALEKVRAKTATLGDIQLDAGDRVTIMKNRISNAIDTLARGVVQSGVLGRAIELLGGKFNLSSLSADKVALAVNSGILGSIPVLSYAAKVVGLIRAGFHGVGVVVWSVAGVIDKVLGKAIAIASVGLGVFVSLLGKLISKVPGLQSIGEGIAGAGDSIVGFGQNAKVIFGNSAAQAFDTAAEHFLDMKDAWAQTGEVDQQFETLRADLEKFRDTVLAGSGAANDLTGGLNNAGDATKVDVWAEFSKRLADAQAFARQATEQIGALASAGDSETLTLFLQSIGDKIDDLRKSMKPADFERFFNAFRAAGGGNDAVKTLSDFGIEAGKAARFAGDLSARVKEGNLSAGDAKVLYDAGTQVLEKFRDALPITDLIRLEEALRKIRPDSVVEGVRKFGLSATEAGQQINDFERVIERGNMTASEATVIFKAASGIMDEVGNTLPIEAFERLREVINATRPDAAVEALRTYATATDAAVEKARDLGAALREGGLSAGEQSSIYHQLADDLGTLREVLDPSEYLALVDALEKVRQAHEETFGATFGQRVAESIGLVKTEIGTFAQDVKDAFADVVAGAVDQVGNAVADVLTKTRTAGEALRAVGKAVVSSLISTLVRLGIQRIVLGAINKTTLVAEATAEGAKGVAIAAINSFAWASAFGGPLAGAAAAATAIKLATAAGLAGGAIGGALGATIAGTPAAAAGGVAGGPTRILAGEAGRELFLPLTDPRSRQAIEDSGLGRSIARAMQKAGVGGGGGGTNIQVSVTLSAPGSILTNGTRLPARLRRELATITEQAVADGLARRRR